MEIVNIQIDDRTQALDTQAFNKVMVVDVTKRVNYQEADQVSAFVGILPTDESYVRLTNILEQQKQTVALVGFEATPTNIAEHMEQLDTTRFMHINVATHNEELFKAFTSWCGANDRFISFTPAIPDGIIIKDDAEAIESADMLAQEVNSANAIILMHRGTIDPYENARRAFEGSFVEGDSDIPDIYTFTTDDVDREQYERQAVVIDVPETNINKVAIKLDSDLSELPLRKLVNGVVTELDSGDLETGIKYVIKSVKLGGLFYWVLVEEYKPAQQYDLASGYIGQFAPIEIGATTSAFKQVNGMPVNYYSVPNQAKTEATNRLNWIQSSYGLSITMDGRTTFKSYLDNEVGKVWLKIKLNEALGGLLVRTNRYAKIPFTNIGKALIDSTLREVIALAERQGFLTPNTTVINIPNPAQIPVNDKGIRTWSGIEVISTIQGAVHQLKVTYVLNL